MNNSIECNIKICSGRPRIKGTRLTVYNVISSIYLEKNINIVYKEFKLTKNQVRDAVNYCYNLKCIHDKSLINFCGNCILSESNDKKELLEIINNFKINNDKIVLTETIKKYLFRSNINSEDYFLMLGWEISYFIKGNI